RTAAGDSVGLVHVEPLPAGRLAPLDQADPEVDALQVELAVVREVERLLGPLSLAGLGHRPVALVGAGDRSGVLQADVRAVGLVVADPAADVEVVDRREDRGDPYRPGTG